MPKYIADFHCHPSLKMHLYNRKIWDDHAHFKDNFLNLEMVVDLPAMKKGNLKLAVATHYLPEFGLLQNSTLLKDIDKLLHIRKKFENPVPPEQPYTDLVKMINRFEEQIREANEKHGFNCVTADKYDDVISALDRGQTVFINSIEGAHSLGNNLSEKNLVSRLSELKNLGVCLITLSHFIKNDLIGSGGGINPDAKKLLGYKDPPDNNTSLSSIGRKAVEWMLDNGIIIDLVHAPKSAREDIYKIVNERRDSGKKIRPIIFSHSGIRELAEANMKKVPEDAYILPDEAEIRKIIELNGVIGVIFMNYWLCGVEENNIVNEDIGIPYIVNTIIRLKEIAGNCDNIAIGTDFDGFSQKPDDLISHASLPKLIEALIKVGFSDDEIDLIAYKNLLRILKDGWGN